MHQEFHGMLRRIWSHSLPSKYWWLRKTKRCTTMHLLCNSLVCFSLKPHHIHAWTFFFSNFQFWNCLFCIINDIFSSERDSATNENHVAAQETASVAAPQICTTRAGDANLPGSRSRKLQSVEATLATIPWKELEMWKPLLHGCGAKWLSRQLRAQGEGCRQAGGSKAGWDGWKTCQSHYQAL